MPLLFGIDQATASIDTGEWELSLDDWPSHACELGPFLPGVIAGHDALALARANLLR